VDGHTASAGPAGSRPEPVRRPQTDTLPTFTPLDNPLRLAYGVGPTALRPQLPAGAARPGWRRLGRPKSRSRRRPPASSRIGRPTRPLGDPRWSPRPPRLGAPREGGSPATLHRPGRPLQAQARRRECRRDVDDFGLRDGGEERCEGAMCPGDGLRGRYTGRRAHQRRHGGAGSDGAACGRLWQYLTEG
jgi:hypothetical protein